MSHKKIPTVVIVGRVNVGKSTFFNRVSHDAQSVTYDVPGVTRDLVTEVITWENRQFTLVDTGGVRIGKIKDSIEDQVRQRALATIDNADVVLFMIDGSVGVLSEDYEISKVLHKRAKQVFLVVNKIDIIASQEYTYEWDKLGFPSYTISATHGRGFLELMTAVTSELPIVDNLSESAVIPPRCRVAIIGKPNVGKSSLMNILTQKDRAIVADVPGTTREAISEAITFYQEDIKLTDTPGIRRKRGVTLPLEQLMVKSALRAIDAAHIVLLMVDASIGTLSDQELKLAFYAFKQKYKSLIIIFNKHDIVESEQKETLDMRRKEYKYLLDKVATITISCKTGKNVGKVLSLIKKVWDRSKQRFEDEKLSLLIREQLQRRPLYKTGQMLTFARARQTRVAPITIELYVGNPPVWGSAQLGYIENQLRRAYDLQGAAIELVLRKRRR